MIDKKISHLLLIMFKDQTFNYYHKLIISFLVVLQIGAKLFQLIYQDHFYYSQEPNRVSKFKNTMF